MKRFHVHVAVPDLQKGVRFYATIFGAEPAVVRADYAKWMLEDPRLNFAISQRDAQAGVNHLGFQVDSEAELEALHTRLAKADAEVREEKGVACCYARSDKYWVSDPAGVAWESFHRLGSVPFFHGESQASHAGDCGGRGEEAKPQAACCA